MVSNAVFGFMFIASLFVLDVRCQVATCSNSYELNVDFKGNDLLSYPIFVASVDLCCVACSNYPTCEAWTYVPGNLACWLKNSTVVERTISSGRLSAVAPKSPISFTLQPGTTTTASGIQTPTTTLSQSTPTTTLSQNTPTTTLSQNTPTTTVSTSTTTPTTVTTTVTRTTTTTAPPTTTTTTSTTTTPPTTTTTTATTSTTTTVTSTITTTSTSPPTTPTTTTTTTIPTTTTTTIPTTTTTTLSTPTTTSTVSTTTTTDTTTAASSSGCFVEDNINYVGNDIASQFVNDASDCCNLCGANTTCVVWTYLKDFKFCYLKDAAPTLENRQTYATAMSGVVTLR